MPTFVVVGGGLAGLMTVIRLAEKGAKVQLFSYVPVRRSHSVCAQGGINGAVNTKGEGDSPMVHFDDSVYGGDFLANQPPVKAMCEEAPGIIYLLDRMGVPFNRTSEGFIDFRRFGGTKHHRTAFSGATTGQQLMYALDEQVRRYEAEGLVQKFEGWEFLSPVIDGEGRCRGIVALDQRTMKTEAFRAEAVMLATGGPGMLFGKTTNSLINTGTAAAAAYEAGAVYGNGEFIQVHPTTVPGPDKLRLMSESIRGEGGRVWSPRDPMDKRPPQDIPEKDRFYFLEEWYPAYGNLVPRDIATRAIFKICVEMGKGIGGKNEVYLDISHLDPEVATKKLGGVIEIYEKFVGQDPRKVPMRIFPGVHYSMGGIWCDYRHMTNIPGLFASGEADYQYHGANRLGANSLLSCIFSGKIAGPFMMEYAKSLPTSSEAAPASVFDAQKKKDEAVFDRLYAMNGTENAYKIHEELGQHMTNYVTVVRENKRLEATDKKILELQDRYSKIGIQDKGRWMNQEVTFARQLGLMFGLSRAITLGALKRNESRGAHYKPEFPDRNDKDFLKTTRATYTPEGPKLEYEAVDTSLIPPRTRNYDTDKSDASAKPAAAPKAPTPAQGVAHA